MDQCCTTADRVAAAVEAIRRSTLGPATTAVILGTGLGELADELASPQSVPYCDIPGFPRSTALAHRGRLVCGELAGAPVLMMQGRCHLYEGYSLAEVTFPVRVLAALGVKTLVVTNAAGGLNPHFAAGGVMLIEDHINLMNLSARHAAFRAIDHAQIERQPASPPRGHLYDRALAAAALATARRHDFALHCGTYVAVSGPSYETRAEYRAFRRLGGDCVGMSTVPEVLTAAASGLRVLGLSTITNVACPDAPKPVTAEEVVEVAEVARPRIGAIVGAIVLGCRES